MTGAIFAIISLIVLFCILAVILAYQSARTREYYRSRQITVRRFITDNKKRKMVYKSKSPSGKWMVEIGSPANTGDYFHAHFKGSSSLSGPIVYNIPFGYYSADSTLLTARWDLPDETFGVYIEKECFLLFRYGHGRRRNREYCHFGEGNGFSEQQIAWICSKDHKDLSKKPRRLF